MADKTYDIELKVDVQSANLGELEKELSRLNEEIKKVPRNSKEFQTAAKNIKAVSGEVEKTTSRLQKLDIGQIAGDFAKVGAAVGAATIVFQQFGEEGSASNEQIQKTLERTQAILGLVAVAEGVVSAARLASTVATRAYAAAQTAANAAVASGTISLKGLRAALISTGIGALVVALGLVVANFDKIKDFFTGGATGRYEGEVKKLESAEKSLNSQLEQRLAFADRLLAEGEDEIKNIEYRISVQKEYNEQLIAANERVLESLRAIKAENGSLTADQLEQQNKIFAANEKARKAVVDLETQRKDARLKVIEDEGKQAVALAQISGKETFDIESANLKKRIAILKEYGTRYKSEVQSLENEVALIEERKRVERENKRKAAEEKRRAELRKGLEELSNLVVSADPLEQINQLEAERTKLLELYNKTVGGGVKNIKDYNAVLKALRSEGLDEVANSIERLVAKEGGFADFEKILNRVFSDRSFAAATQYGEALTLALEKIGAKAQGAFLLTSESAKLLEGSADTVQSFYSTVKKAADDPDFGFEITATSGVQDFFDYIATGQKELDKYIRQVRFAGANAIATIESLKLPAEQQAVLIARVQEQVDGLVKTAKDQNKAIVDDLLTQRADAIAKAIEKTNLASQQQLALFEKNALSLRGKLDNFLEGGVFQQLRLQKKVQEAELDGIKQLDQENETLYKKGLISKKEYEDNKLQLAKDRAAKELEIEQTNAEKLEQIFKDVLGVAEAGLDLFQAIIDLQRQQAELASAQSDIEIARLEANKEKELQVVGLTEKKKAEITEQYDYAIANARNAQIKANAEAQIKGAETGFALNVAQITINGAVAALKALADLGPIAGTIAAIAIGVTTALQIKTAKAARDTAIAQANAALAGIVPPANPSGGRVLKAATGGLIQGPGSGTSDSIPARLSNGEFVVNAASTAAYLPLLEQINAQGNRFANGGQSGPDLQDILSRLERRLATPPKAYVVSSELQANIDKEEYITRRAEIL